MGKYRCSPRTPPGLRSFLGTSCPRWAQKDRTSRAYGSTHMMLRERYAALVASGLADCARCGRPIEPGSAWDLGHTDDRSGDTGAEHRYCNRVAGAAVDERPSRRSGHDRGTRSDHRENRLV
jgi:hypothetical protein